MPDLVFRRRAPAQPKKACMYCGGPATHVRERRIRNPRIDPRAGGGGGGLGVTPPGDDPISGCIALVLLPFVLIGLGRQARDAWRHRAAERAAPPLDPSHTVVTVTTCDRHRRYGRRFVKAGLLGALVLAVAWVPAVLGGPNAPLWLVGGVVVGTVAFPMILLLIWSSDGPVRVSAVTRDTVTITDVRQAYFDAVER